MRSRHYPDLLLSKFLMVLIAAWLVVSTGVPARCQAVYQINCGGNAVGTWVADEFFNGGGENGTTAAIDTSSVTNPARQEVYQNQRINGYGGFTYTLQTLTANTGYTVRLHFAEIRSQQPGQNVFNVVVNNPNGMGTTPVLTNYDVAAAAGAQNKAVVTAFDATADANGNITIVFSQANGGSYAIINGIEVLTGTQTVISAAPTGLKAVPGVTSVALSWQALSGATGYNILRSTSTSGPFVRINPNTIAGTTYTDTGLTSLTYYYEVLAVNALGEGPSSAYVSAKPTVNTFTLSVNPSAITLARGSSAALTVAMLQPMRSGTVSLKLSGIPKGVTAFCYPSVTSFLDPVSYPKITWPTDGANAVLHLSVGTGAAVGPYTLIVTGKTSTYTTSTTLTLMVN